MPYPSPGGEAWRVAGGGRSRRERLRVRADVLRAIRAFFDARGYLEVQTPVRVTSPGLEPHLRAVPSDDAFLITSPEYQLKRLLAAGIERPYFLGPCFRAEEEGPLHHGEFCMLEWYEAYADLPSLMRQTEELVRAAARAANRPAAAPFRGAPLDLDRPFVRLTVREAFDRYAGIDLRGVMDAIGLRRAAEAAGHGPFPGDAHFDAVFSELLVTWVEPHLAQLGAVFLTDFPAPLAALARLCPEDPTVAERFELYLGGVELANAFGELTDPVEQERRLHGDLALRAELGAPVYPIDERFLEALREGIPPAAGIALGIDRLLLVLCDADRLDEVVAFAPDEL
ncbi:MAG: EF-P lysine aminoacylase GenX [Deltaproteobacteria bacterium]|nr:EF-P lysine aminoacylase GenX [Deltaproteobacteria bacterium]